MTAKQLESLFDALRRFPDVEAVNLQAYDATDKLLLQMAASDHILPETNAVVIGDRYGALTLGALVGTGVGHVRVNQDLYTGRLALQRNAEAAGLQGRFSSHELGAELLEGANLVLMQLPKSLAELEENADAVARYAAPDAVLLAGGRVKHMSLAGPLFLFCPTATCPAEVPGTGSQQSQTGFQRASLPCCGAAAGIGDHGLCSWCCIFGCTP